MTLDTPVLLEQFIEFFYNQIYVTILVNFIRKIYSIEANTDTLCFFEWDFAFFLTF